MKSITCLIYIITTLILMSCSPDPDKAILGVWELQNGNGPNAITFFQNGRVIAEVGGNERIASYELLDDEKVLIKEGNDVNRLTYSVERNNLTIIFNADTVKYRRID